MNGGPSSMYTIFVISILKQSAIGKGRVGSLPASIMSLSS